MTGESRVRRRTPDGVAASTEATVVTPVPPAALGRFRLTIARARRMIPPTPTVRPTWRVGGLVRTVGRRSPSGVFAGLGLLLLASMIGATALGTVSLPIGQVLRVLTGRPVHNVADTIIVAIRLPRVFMAAMVGGGLALSGAVLQGLFRNPLADPGLLGVSSGAGFAAVVAIALGVAHRGLWLLPLWAFAGALLASALVYLLAVRHGRTPVLTLVLAGVAISALFAAGTTLILTQSSLATDVRAMLDWLYGGLDGALWRQDAGLVPFVLIGGAGMALFARELNVLATGEEGASALGVPVETARRVLLALASLVTGAAVSVAGPIAFVGLIVPHMLRMLIGADHRLLLPASLLGGGIFLVLADLLARVIIRPAEINIGVVTAILGVPFFLYLLRRTGGERT